MIEFAGQIRKMRSAIEAPGEHVNYLLPIGEDVVHLNEHIGKDIALSFEGEIHCLSCQRKIKKSYSQGYCYPCSQKLAACDLCIMKPELCHYAAGTCRQPEWGDANCNIKHYVYIANTGEAKVGITRHTQVPTRWVDQGAVQARVLYQTQSRLLAGLAEVALKCHIKDKTNWRNMLKQVPESIDLEQLATSLRQAVADDIHEILALHGSLAITEVDDIAAELNYPVEQYPDKVVSIGFDKKPDIEGKLLGIKGQYLILDSGVLNIRKHTAYHIKLGL